MSKTVLKYHLTLALAQHPPVFLTLISQIANYLGPLHRALSGDTESISQIEKIAKSKFGARIVKRIPVSGAFHSEFMQTASGPLQEVHLFSPNLVFYILLTGNQ